MALYKREVPCRTWVYALNVKEIIPKFQETSGSVRFGSVPDRFGSSPVRFGPVRVPEKIEFSIYIFSKKTCFYLFKRRVTGGFTGYGLRAAGSGNPRFGSGAVRFGSGPVRSGSGSRKNPHLFIFF